MLVMLLVLSVSAFAVGCGQDDPAPQEEAQVETTKLLMATGGTGGTYYPLGGGMANVWNDTIANLNVTVQSTGASVENIRLLAAGETELAMAMNGPAIRAVSGTGEWEGKPVDNIAAIGVIYPEIMQIVAPKDSGIVTVADLKGKRVSVGPPGSGTASAALKILEAHGLDPEQDINKFQDTFADAARKIKDGQLDASFAVMAVPAASIIDISISTPVTIVSIEGAALEKLLEIAPAFSTFEIPAGTYDGQDEAVQTVSQWAVLYVRKDLPEELVFNITKAMYEQTEKIAAAHARGNQISIDNALKGIYPVPFHPGAIRYFQEQGLK